VGAEVTVLDKGELLTVTETVVVSFAHVIVTFVVFGDGSTQSLPPTENLGG